MRKFGLYEENCKTYIWQLLLFEILVFRLFYMFQNNFTKLGFFLIGQSCSKFQMENKLTRVVNTF